MGRLLVSSGEVIYDRPLHIDKPLKRGMTIAVTLAGTLSCWIDDRDETRVVGPAVSLIVAREPHRREQVFFAGDRLTWLLLHIDATLVEEFCDADFDRLVNVVEAAAGHANPVFLTRPADREVKAVASKLMSHPVGGLARPLFRMGLALELASLVLERSLSIRSRHRGALSSREAEQLDEARSILSQNLCGTPTLPVLAHRVGLNERKLNAGFRCRFGLTVHAYLQELRLRQAHRMLVAGGVSVSEVAFSVGYAPAHFATLFKKRFGMSPSELR